MFMSTTVEDTAFSGDVKEEESKKMHSINPGEDSRVTGITYTKGLTDTFIGYRGEVNPDIE